eukprot:NODE_454_length_8261_cov_0.201054.p2 type:complete len:432 gc:universal NODE_454_length_8261_cov_0.201054:6776-5481(-)
MDLISYLESPPCFTIDIVGNSRYINTNLESLPPALIALSSYLSFGSSASDENVLKRKPHPNYIFQYQTEKFVYTHTKAIIYHCGCLINAFEPLILQSWKLRMGIEFGDSIIPLLSKKHLLNTLVSSKVTDSHYKWLYEGAMSLKVLFESWNSKFSELLPFDNVGSIYSKYITLKDLCISNSDFKESNPEKCVEILKDFLEEMEKKHNMIKREILIVGTPKSGKTQLANRLSQYYQLDLNSGLDSTNYGFVVETNELSLKEISAILEKVKPKTVIVLAHTLNDLLPEILEFCNSQLFDTYVYGPEHFEYSKTTRPPDCVVWPRDDYIFKDCRYKLFEQITKDLKDCFAFDIPKAYNKKELERIHQYKESIEELKNPPIEELLYEIPNSEYSKNAAATLEMVLPVIISGLKKISLEDKKTVLVELGKYLLDSK